ncbi:MAG: GTPase Era [Treponema sp.]|jgi:GTP-binding protein Era|nr:GTPase Era [Treponema sp.]
MMKTVSDLAGAGPGKAAFVAVAGRPSVGKSTLVNRICGAKVAIVSAVPQTTRNAIRGILNRPEGQLVFVDTPGRHASERKFNKKLLEVSNRSLAEADLRLYVLDALRPPGPEEEDAARALGGMTATLVAAVNKTDAPGADPARAAAFLAERLPALPPERIFPVSALNGGGVEALVSCLFGMATAGEPFYPPEYYTDQETAFRISEIIRGEAINRLRQELPHALYVEVADMELKKANSGTGAGPGLEPPAPGPPELAPAVPETTEPGTLEPAAPETPKPAGRERLWVRAFIVVERESQKGMVVGKGGAMIRAIRLAALKELDRIFDWKIDLDLRVKTGKDWRHNDVLLRRITGG